MFSTILLVITTVGVIYLSYQEYSMKASVTELNTQIATLKADLVTFTNGLVALTTLANSDDPDVVAAVGVLTAANANFATLLAQFKSLVPGA